MNRTTSPSTPPPNEASHDLNDDRLQALRPRLHRYCCRLLASPLDAEDVVQDVLMRVLRQPRLADDDFENWLFRVAYNRSMDYLRARAVRERPRAATADPVGRSNRATMTDPVSALEATEQAFGHLIAQLPAKERTSLIAKDVLGYSLAETADIVGSSVGGVKAALHRARRRLRDLGVTGDPTAANTWRPTHRSTDDPQRRLVEAYVERFNGRDWAGLVALLRGDARLRVLDVVDRRGAERIEQHYFRNYSRLLVDWRAEVVPLAGDWMVLIERWVEGKSRPYALVRVDFDGHHIATITDTLHAPPYLIEAVATSLGRAAPAPFEPSHFEDGFVPPPRPLGREGG